MTCPLSGTNDQILAGYFALLTASLLPRRKRTFETEQESKHPSHLPCCVNDQILPSILHCRPILTPAEQMISFDTGKRRSILHAHTVTQACTAGYSTSSAMPTLPRNKRASSAGKGYYPARPPMAQADMQGKTKAGPFAGTERVCWQPLFVHENASVQILRSEQKRFVERATLACVLRCGRCP